MKSLRPETQMTQYSFTDGSNSTSEFPIKMIQINHKESSYTTTTTPSLTLNSTNNNFQLLEIENELDQAIPHLIFSYLTHYGYGQSAQSFLSQWTKGRTESPLTDEEKFSSSTLDHRSQLRKMIGDGHISEAIAFVEEFFPQIFAGSDGCLLKFKLQCQQFIEMVRCGDSVNALEYTETTLSPMAQQDSRFLAPLQEVVVLLAYSVPHKSPAAPLLSIEYRDNLVHLIDSAILKRNESALETILKQMIYLHSLLPESEKRAIREMNPLLAMEELFKNSEFSL